MTETPVDLMLDCKFGDDGEPVAVFHIVKFASNHFNVVRDGKVTVALTWGETVEHVVDLIHPQLGAARYREQTREEFQSEQRRHAEFKGVSAS